MSINKNMFLDFEGLLLYDEKIKEYVNKKAGVPQEDLSASLEQLAASVDSANAAIEILNADSDTLGSVDQKVKDAIAALVGNAPEAFDTLKEIADWIASDETGTTALVNRLEEAEDAIDELEEHVDTQNESLKTYIDSQDKAYYDSISRIEEIKVSSLFPVSQGETETVISAIGNLTEGSALKLTASQTIEDNIVINKSCYIDANGSTFTGEITIPQDKEVIIENATFSNPITVA